MCFVMSDCRPNAGFVEQLKLWEAMKWRINSNYKPFKAYSLRQHAKQMKGMHMTFLIHCLAERMVNQ